VNERKMSAKQRGKTERFIESENTSAWLGPFTKVGPTT